MNWETLQQLIIDHFGAFVIVSGVGITAIGSLIVAAINSRSTTMSKFITEVRLENADKQTQINLMKTNHQAEIKEIKAESEKIKTETKEENRKLNIEVRKLMKRLHITQDYVDELIRHIKEEKDPPAPPRPKGYYGLDDNNNNNN